MNKPATFGQLKQNIRAEITNISQDLMHSVMENVIKRAHFCQRLNGALLLEITFKT